MGGTVFPPCCLTWDQTMEIKPVHPKGNQSWLFNGRIDAEAPILWPPDVKNWLIGKDPDAGKDWRQEEKGMTEDEMVGWHHWLNGHEFEQALGVGDGQGSLACYSPWGPKESDTTEQLNWVFQEKLTSLGYSKVTFTNSGNMSISYMESPIRIRFHTHLHIVSITKMSRKWSLASWNCSGQKSHNLSWVVTPPGVSPRSSTSGAFLQGNSILWKEEFTTRIQATCPGIRTGLKG